MMPQEKRPLPYRGMLAYVKSDVWCRFTGEMGPTPEWPHMSNDWHHARGSNGRYYGLCSDNETSWLYPGEPDCPSIPLHEQHPWKNGDRYWWYCVDDRLWYLHTYHPSKRYKPDLNDRSLFYKDASDRTACPTCGNPICKNWTAGPRLVCPRCYEKREAEECKSCGWPGLKALPNACRHPELITCRDKKVECLSCSAVFWLDGHCPPHILLIRGPDRNVRHYEMNIMPTGYFVAVIKNSLRSPIVLHLKPENDAAQPPPGGWNA